MLLAEGRKRLKGRREREISFRQGQRPRGLSCPDRLLAAPCVIEGEGPGPVRMAAKQQELSAVCPGGGIRCPPDRRLVVRAQGCEQRLRSQPPDQPFGVTGGGDCVDLLDGSGCILLPTPGDDRVREIHQSGGLDPPVAASSSGAQRVLDCLLGTLVIACPLPHPGVEECHGSASHVQVEVRKPLAGLLHQRARVVLFPCHRLKHRLEPEQSKPGNAVTCCLRRELSQAAQSLLHRGTAIHQGPGNVYLPCGDLEASGDPLGVTHLLLTVLSRTVRLSVHPQQLGMQIVRSGEAEVVTEDSKYLARLPDHIQACPDIDSVGPRIQARALKLYGGSPAHRRQPEPCPLAGTEGSDVRRAVERSRLDERGGQDGQQLRCGS